MLQPHAAVPSPPLLPEFRQVRRAPPRRADFQQFGYADSCPLCANARAGRKQAVDRSEPCRSSMDAILATTAEGLLRLERARERFAQFAEEPVDCHEGEGGAASSRHQHQESWSRVSEATTRKVAAAAAAVWRCLPVIHRHLKSWVCDKKYMTGAPVEQQGVPKRRQEQPTVPEAAESTSGSSSNSERSTDTEKGLVVM